MRAVALESPTTLSLRLFVAGREPNSATALENLRKLRDTLRGFDLRFEVIDVLEDHQAALEQEVFVTPCLVRHEPPPRVVIIGSLKDLGKVRAALGLPPAESADG